MGHAAPLKRAGRSACFVLAVLAPVRLGDSPQDPQIRASDKGPAPETPRGPPVRKPIAGIAGFESVSKLAYPAAPDRPHQLRTTYVFPERVRWQISRPQGESSERLLQYRYGETVYRMSPGVSSSVACSGEERAGLLLQMELRRALMLFPQGFEWKGTGLERRAELGDLGCLFARFASASDPLPVEIGNAGSDGQAIDTYKSVRWKEIGSRRWPESLELWHAGEIAWRETIESVDVQAQYVDSFFLPPDRRDRSAAEPVAGSVRELELPATCLLRIELEKGTSWQDACAESARRRADWSKRLSGPDQELDPNGTLEISQEGEAVAVLLRLKKVPEESPAGFSTVQARRALACQSSGTREARAERLAELKKALPRGSIEAAPYVRFESGGSTPGRFFVVLPYTERR